MSIHSGQIATLETKMVNVGESLGSMCTAIDFLGDTGTNATPLTPTLSQWDCCSNQATLKTQCEKRFVLDNQATRTITEGTEGVCQSSDSQCS